LEAESDIQAVVPSSQDKIKKPKKKAKVSFHEFSWPMLHMLSDTAFQTTIYISDGDTDITVEEVQGTKVCRNPVKAEWAFSLWTP
jgi:hypothetical protein